MTAQAGAAKGAALRGPVKRSVMIAGHATSVSLEPLFWWALQQAAGEDAVPVSALVARIDADRAAAPDPANLASALRTWLLARALDRAGVSPAEYAAPSPRRSP